MGMSILKQNLEVFCKTHADYADWLNNPPTNGSTSIVKHNGVDVLLQGSEIIDTTNPLAHKSIKFPDNDPSIIVIEGFGLGASIMSIAQKYHSKKMVYIIVEPSVERFIAALSYRDLRPILASGGAMWFIGTDMETLFNKVYMSMFDLWLGPRKERKFFYTLPSLQKKEQLYFKQVREQIKHAGDLAYGSFGAQDDCFLGISNTYQNVKNIANSGGLQHLEGKFKDIPALIVATGPSLTKSMDMIKSVQDKCLIIAADASYQPLLKAGITPHLTVSIERVKLTEKFFRDAPVLQDKPKGGLVVFPLTPPSTINLFDGPVFNAYRNYNYFNYLKRQVDRPMLSCGHGVTHMACKVADYLGVSEIVLIGQDLCYSDDFKTHAEGVTHGDTQKKTFEELKKYAKEDGKGAVHIVRGNLQDKVVTNDLWLYFMKEFIMEQKDTKATIYNATMGGATLPAVPWAPFTKFMERWKPHKKDLFKVIKENYKEPEVKEINLEPLLITFSGLKKQYKKMISSLQKARTLKEKKIRQAHRSMIEFKHKLAADKDFLGYVYESDVKLLAGIEIKIYEEKDPLKQIDLWISWLENLTRITNEVEDLVKESCSNVSS